MRVIVLLSTMLLLNGGTAAAAEVSIKQPWARASLNANGVVYLTIENASGEPARLVGAETPAAGHAMLMTNAGGHRQMDAWNIPGRGRIEAKPAGDGLHVMLMGLSKPLKTGDSFPLTLRFEDGDTRTVEVRVFGPGALKPE